MLCIRGGRRLAPARRCQNVKPYYESRLRNRFYNHRFLLLQRMNLLRSIRWIRDLLTFPSHWKSRGWPTEADKSVRWNFAHCHYRIGFKTSLSFPKARKLIKDFHDDELKELRCVDKYDWARLTHASYVLFDVLLNSHVQFISHSDT